MRRRKRTGNSPVVLAGSGFDDMPKIRLSSSSHCEACIKYAAVEEGEPSMDPCTL